MVARHTAAVQQGVAGNLGPISVFERHHVLHEFAVGNPARKAS
jgi:hypothetical protein